MSRLDPFPAFTDFSHALDPKSYAPLPADWVVGVTDVVRSGDAVAAGRYKAVNMAGAAAISAVMNALGTNAFPFAFAGDGCAFALPGADTSVARTTLAATAAFVRDEMELELRVALLAVEAIRAGGADVRVALYRPSPHVAYAMFDGGGISSAEAAMKAGTARLPAGAPGERPDLTGLSCRWLPLASRNGAMVSVIALPAAAGEAAFAEAARAVIALLGDPGETHPVPAGGPRYRFTLAGADLEARAGRVGPLWRRRLGVAAHTALGAALFRTGLKAGAFDPAAYRARTALNADCRKFGDGLLLTLDCTPDLAARLEHALEDAAAAGTLRFGLHRQDAALMTCIVPSYADPGHFHFIDGADGGYTAAARDLKRRAAALPSAGLTGAEPKATSAAQS